MSLFLALACGLFGVPAARAAGPPNMLVIMADDIGWMNISSYGDVARQYAEHKTWVLTPVLGVVQDHLATFQEFPIRQRGLSADVGKTIEGIQSQILRSREAGN